MAIPSLIISNNFVQTKAQFNELINYMTNTLRVPLTLKLNIGEIQNQLRQITAQTEQFKATMSSSMGLNTGGFDKVMTTVREIEGGMGKVASTVTTISSNMGQVITTTTKHVSLIGEALSIQNQISQAVVKTTDNYKTQLAIKEKSIAMGESGLIQRENVLLAEATALMTKKLNLEQQIKVAKESGNLPLQRALILREQEVALQLQSARASLSNSSEATKSTLLQREVEIRASIVLQNAKILGQGQLEATEIKRRIALYQQEKELQMAGMNQKYGSSINTANLAQAQLAIRQLGTSGITSLSQLNAKEQQVNMSLKEIGANARVASNALKQTGGLSGAFNGLVSNMKSMAIWSLTAGAIFGTVNAIKEGIGSALEMDKTLSILSITMNGTKSDFQAMAKEIQSTAIATGSSVEAVSDASKIYANMGETASSILEKTRSAIMLSNVTGLDTSQTTDSVHAILNQYNEVGKTATVTSEHVANSLVAISKNMAMDFGSLKCAD